MRTVRFRRLACVPAWVLAMTAAPVLAQVADPTRPPAVLTAAPAASGAARPAAAPASAPVPVRPRVQSVQVPAEGRASALVDDRLVFVGDRVGERTVVAIDAQGLQLRNAKGQVESLPLIDAQVVVKHNVPQAGTVPAPVASLAGRKQP